jgi:putative hemolysin
LLLALPVAATTASYVSELGFLLLLLLLSGVFSGSEVALFSLSETDRERLRHDSSAAARRVLRMLERPRRLLITILMVNNLVNVAAAILATFLTLRVARAWGFTETPYGEAGLFAVQVILLTFLLLVLSEITPKLIATHRNIRFAKATSLPLYALFRLFQPLTSLLADGMEFVHQRVRTPSQVISSEDLKTLADMGEREGTLEQEERALIHSIVEFGETTVREVMVSRLDVHALPDDATLDEAFGLIRDTGHSRFPIYRDHLDNVLGILYAKDLIPYLNGNGQAPPAWTDIGRPARFVPLARTLDDMLADFQASGTHIAVVVDEYGGTAGIVTLEDILEEIVGDIRDEHDQPETVAYERIGPTTYRVDASIDLDDLNEAFGLELDTGAFDFETLGGLIFQLVGDIPEAGTTAAYGRLRMRVEEVEGNRIKHVVVEVLPEAPDLDGEAAAPGTDEEWAERRTEERDR